MMKEDIEKTSTKEIDLIALFMRIFEEKRLLAKFILVLTIVGIVYALGKPKEYTASVVLAPEATSMGMSSSLSDIAGMMGLEMGQGGKSIDAIYPDIYPDIFASTDFIVRLFNIPVRLSKEKQTKTYSEHLVQDTPIPFWMYPISWMTSLFASKKDTAALNKEVNVFLLTKQQNNLCKLIRGKIECQPSKGTNVITISATDYDPMVAAILVDTLQNRLQDYILQYRTHKARIDLEYAIKLNAEAKDQYIKARQAYSSYSDANTDLILTSYKAKQQDMENEMQLKYNNYSQTTNQVVQAKAKVQENTPVFTVIQQASVPLSSSSTPRSFIVLGFIVLGFFCHAAWVLALRSFYHKYLKKRK